MQKLIRLVPMRYGTRYRRHGLPTWSLLDFIALASCWCHDKMDVDLELDSTDDECTPSSLEQPLKKKLVRHSKAQIIISFEL